MVSTMLSMDNKWSINVSIECLFLFLKEKLFQKLIMITIDWRKGVLTGDF